MSVSRLKKPHEKATYNYKKGWSTTAQPVGALTAEEYIEIAAAASPELTHNARVFLEQHQYSFVAIPHEAFLEYERSDLTFREWLEQYCDEKNAEITEQAIKHGLQPALLDSRADFAIIGSRIKTLKSAQGKTSTGERTPDRLIDYLGILFVALKQKNTPQNKTSLATMSRLMDDIEKNEKTLAIKNHYWEPHRKTQFRAHKSLRLATVPENHPDLAGFEILVEVKIEHESQMDIDKLTRKFINIGRSGREAPAKLYEGVQITGLSAPDSKRAAKFCLAEQEKMDAIDALGAALYNRVFADANLNQLMNPQISHDFPALSKSALLEATKTTVEEHFTNGNKRHLLEVITKMEMFKALIPQQRQRKRTHAA